MDPLRRKPTSKAHICVISYKALSQLIERITPEYAGVAKIQIVDAGMDQAVTTARKYIASGRADVFVSAGANGALLRENLVLPVAMVKVSGFDVIAALRQARQMSARIGVVCYRTIYEELEAAKQLLGLEVEQRTYRSAREILACVSELAQLGCEVIVGASLTVEHAERLGLAGVLVYSEQSIRLALDDAIEMARGTRGEEARRERLNAVLHHLDEGVVAVGLDERIEAINPAMQQLLGMPTANVLGKRLSEIAPTLSLVETLASGQRALHEVALHQKLSLVINRIPIFEQGELTGGVLTCQDAGTVQNADRKLRAKTRPNNFVARYSMEQILGVSNVILEIKALATEYAKTNLTVLINGESGTGKELFAQGIHNASRRRDAPFVALNCAAFPENLLESELFGYEDGAFTGSRKGGKPGLIEAAHTGTLFLDEVGDMPPPLQTRLLRVLQERELMRVGADQVLPIDVRVIAATHRDLSRDVTEGRFRLDLFYRLNILKLDLPPLRERSQDLAHIAGQLLEEVLSQVRGRHSAQDLLEILLPYLRNYPWPGNIRELSNILERICASCMFTANIAEHLRMRLPVLAPELFQTPVFTSARKTSQSDLRTASRELVIDQIRYVLRECGGNHAEAARRLGISKATIWRKIRAYEIGDNSLSVQ